MQIVDSGPKLETRKALRAGLVVIPLLCSLTAGVRAQAEERLAENRRQAIARGRDELRGALYSTIAANLQGLEAAIALRALIVSGSGANDPEVAPLLRKVAEGMPGDDPEILAAQVRLLAQSGPRTFRTEIARRLAALERLEIENGGWRSPRPEKDKERPDDDTLTAHVLLAFRDAVRVDLAIAESVAQRGVQFLLERRARDGSFGHLGRRARSHGRATASVLAALLWARTDKRFETLHSRIDESLAPALAWLYEEFTPDRNPGTPTQLFPWLDDVRLLLSFGALPLTDRGATRTALETFLVSYELPNGGWNREANLQDIMRPPLPKDSVPGRVPVGTPIARVRADVLDTAHAVLALSESNEATESEWSAAITALFGDPRLLPREREERAALQRFLVNHARRTAPILIRLLASPERIVRHMVFDALEEIAGDTFDYSPNRKAEDNQEALQRWQQWWFEKGRFL